MITPAKTLEAILIMDSRSTSSMVRNHVSHEVWDRLYMVDGHYLDLSLRVEAEGPFLTGKIVTSTPVKGTARLVAKEGDWQQEVALNTLGMFRLPFSAGKAHQLELVLNERPFVVDL